ncbi:FAD-binding protein [Brachyspira hyodysenteriae]|uniref:FAD-binding protein n=1 Tax=Brachyspira hyodysenteriae TaxID=159 RepID=UPI0022CDADEF|nr:FAD-binding protein [Brachyspira hyodysenteriae]MCZ9850699.1 FAD-binding protein [Brachyspira hyodysenteriae]MCZ9860548.1 FAD-binding protein [Brachyspira hyodysenteriae]MCZ9891450.1 FAD-binding protein [Brachyspira hyodysenteriae]MCZ9895593.1 FAD-binding protein [Brachyspira hyodysenteriae]MCZ9917035.1 FAD-binding protein [Brachyspira hyodysenteriae]
MNINKEFYCDVLIVGGGISGLIAAERALKVFKRVCIADSSKICFGASYFPLKATLGIQATKDENDYDKYYEDITNMGKGVENPELIKTYIKNIKRDVYLLKRIGFKPWLRKDSRPACFAKYSRNIFLINDWNGARKRANKIFRKNKRLKIFEGSSLIRIIKNNDKVYGAIFQNKDKFFFIKSKVIILAAGGIAGNYKNSLYPKKINGTCHITALDAGAYAQNMEFIQFIPAYLKPKYNVLFGEHTLKYCIGMYDEDNKLIFDGINNDNNKKLWIERSAYAPFSIDFESSEIDLKIPYSGVKLKYSEDLYKDKEEFYTVYLDWLKKEMNIDLLKDETLITHFAHSCNGGIKIDSNGFTGVNGLYAIGELSSGIEGANRLGGNSVGGALVFGNNAVKDAYKYIKNNKFHNNKKLNSIEKEFNDWIDDISKDDKENTLTKNEVLDKIRELVSENLSVVRSKEKIEIFLRNIYEIRSNYSIKENIKDGSIEIYLILESVKMIALSMLERDESRGAHYREDFKYSSDKIYKVQLKRENNKTIAERIYN